MKIIEKRFDDPVIGRSAIERISQEDLRFQINSKGSLAQENAYGEIMSVEEGKPAVPVICGHGGSMWLCRECKDRILNQQNAVAV